MKKLLTLFLVILLSCDLDDKIDEPTLKIRSVLEVSTTSEIKAKVYLEGVNGQAINGALVYILTPYNQMNLLDFDYDIGCYTAFLGSPITGTYSIAVESRAYKDLTREIDFVNLGEDLDFILIQDDSGHDALYGQDISLNGKLSITWDILNNISLYQVKVTKPDGTVYEVSTIENSVLLDNSVLDVKGNYSIQLLAQYIYGDPLFQSFDYYAVNELYSSRFYFEVN
ncbi:hypothetical protein EW093_06880 [Thiospirochaeta perfilievii]|uniref:Uncharacterized protein n=1 Tax=Thiospirochaeta perfilievii TaxID=252967 RepID=A0A5C1QE04_9SPIO|nr:hypothetical protein [Thiospirochaeta perfilievii]QEN04432.1 hypothetical protein EW093_06880 [Thiospirochaeta perfilievii]